MNSTLLRGRIWVRMLTTLVAFGQLLSADTPVCPPSPDATACLQRALREAKPGTHLRLGKGVYGVAASLHVSQEDLVIEGAGDETVLQRTGSVGGGEGLLHVQASGITLRSFLMDGQVGIPQGLPYRDPAGGPSVLGAPIHGDPMHAALLHNSSITIKAAVPNANVTDITIEDITIQRSGGYAILMDARYGGIRYVTLRRLHLRDNQPHVFGKPADLRYGSWTGGIHYQNDGRDLDFARHALVALTIEDSLFERISGHAIWGHGYGFDTLNEEITIRRNRFVDIGMDAVLVANARRAVVEDNHFHRIGYVASPPGTAPRPAWYPGTRDDGADNVPAVGIDTSGLVTDSVYQRNTMWNVNGHCIDLDGFTRGKVLANTMRVSGREDAWNYVNDRVPEFGGHRLGNFTKGINLSNTSAHEPTERVEIAGNRMVNLGGFAIALNDSQRCLVQDNHIRHYGQIYAPIILSNSLRSPRERHESRENVIRDNYIHFYLEAACITEADDLGGGLSPVAGPNYVFDNTCDANTHGEFVPGKQSKSRVVAQP
jgi:hypothetical protein